MTRARDVASQGGLVLINTTSFSAQASVSIDSVFSSTYDNYRVMLSATAPSTLDLNVRFRTDAVDNTSAIYVDQLWRVEGTATTASRNLDVTKGLISRVGTSITPINIDFFNPFDVNKQTQYVANGGLTASAIDNFVGRFAANASFTGFKIYPASSTITGIISVYGYKK